MFFELWLLIMLRRHARRRTAQFHGQGQTCPDPDQSGNIDGQQSPRPCVEPSAEVRRCEDADVFAGHDGDHEQTHEGSQNRSQYSGRQQRKRNGPRFQSAFRCNRICESVDWDEQNDQCADRECDDETEQESTQCEMTGGDQCENDTKHHIDDQRDPDVQRQIELIENFNHK